MIAILHILDLGMYTIVVDQGRPGWRSLGVPVGGAADRFALALGNALVGNGPNCAALEVTLAGPTLRADGELACVLYGALFEITSNQRPLTAGKTFTLQAGEELRIGQAKSGMRAYLCVRGGFEQPLILGSRSGLAPIQAGAELPCQSGQIGARYLRPRLVWNRDLPKTLRVLDGAQSDWFHKQEFYGQQFLVTAASNRMGLRLRGRPLTAPARELVSEPVCPGSVQVTQDGQCIILGVDGQTIGGYPKIAQVATADLDKLGQLRPDDDIRFECVSLEEADGLYRQKQAELREWLTRLLETVHAESFDCTHDLG
jgi:5-oxoprolinase (ATP-hydrolysing) subunit C